MGTKLDGLHFPKDQPQHTGIADHSLSASHMETPRKLLKTRLQSCRAIQFASMEHGFGPVTSDCQYLFPERLVSYLLNGRQLLMRITQSCISPKTLWRKNCLGTLISTTWYSDRGTAKLQAALALNSSYPSIPFIFQLYLNWK